MSVVHLTVTWGIDKDDIPDMIARLSQFTYMYLANKPGHPRPQRVQLEDLRIGDEPAVHWGEFGAELETAEEGGE